MSRSNLERITGGAVVAIALALLMTEDTLRAQFTCFSTHTFGSGRTFMGICITEDGNLLKFESPSSQEHIFNSSPVGEGYVLCSPSAAGGVHGFDSAGLESGFGDPTITQPNGPNTFPLTIVRDTSDGDFRLQQTFTRDTGEHDVGITMKLTNISGSTRSLIQLHRYFNGNISNDGTGDIFDHSEDSVWGRQGNNNEHGLMLTALTFGTAHDVFVEEVDEWNPSIFPSVGARTGRGCSPQNPPPPTPTNAGDFVGRVAYELGTISANRSKTVKVVYRRF
jgi:hypothetical protein